METPNLFAYATTELSQDAVICWLIEWSANSAETDLNALGRNLVESLLSRNGQDGKTTLGGAIRSAKILRQAKHIDVLARINDKHVLLIEDKTESDPHGDQLATYRDAVLSGATDFGAVSENDLFPIYFKTGNQSLAMERSIEQAGYKVFNRGDFLAVLKGYRGDNAIVLDFVRSLESLEDQTRSFRNWRRTGGEREWAAWQGLYRELERRLFAWDAKPRWSGWGYVHNASGGFLGFWWQPLELDVAHPAYLQLEMERLCFKVDAEGLSAERQNELKWEWNERITGQHEWVVKPKVMRRGETMTVAVHEDGWLRYDHEGELDLDATVELLRQAELVLTAAVLPAQGQ